MGWPANGFTTAASMSEIPQAGPSLPWVPALSWGWSRESAWERLLFNLRVCFLLKDETLNHFLKGQGLIPRKAPSHLFSKDSLQVAEIWEGSDKDQEITRPRGRGSLGRPKGGRVPWGQRATLVRAGLLRYVHGHMGSISEPQFPSGLVQALSSPPPTPLVRMRPQVYKQQGDFP